MGPASAAALFLLAGCVTLPETRSVSCVDAARPVVQLSDDGRSVSVEIDVLTYNVEGLSWPARSGRTRHLEEIGNRLAVLRSRSEAPHIILLQEVFSKASVRAIEASQYPSAVAGPGRTQRRPAAQNQTLPGKRRLDRGELGLRILSGGLATVSEFPIVASRAEPFPRGSCAGFDCLANKGMLLTEIAVPGVPGTLLVINTHMNAQRASRVSPSRHHAAHARQVQALSDVLQAAPPGQAVILGGDFNMRGSEQRFDLFEARQTLDLVHHYCIEHGELCDVEMSWDGDAPWMDTQDLQLFSSGGAVAVRPVRVAAMFDGASEPKLSDHDGLRVTYRLSWRTEGHLPAASCPE